MVDKAVRAAAPGKERSAWLARRDERARAIRLRQEAAERATAENSAATEAQETSTAARAEGHARQGGAGAPRARQVRVQFGSASLCVLD